MQDLWKAAIGIAGLGAIASFVLWSIYKGFLQLPIFQQLTQVQLYNLLRLLLVLTFLFAIAGLVTYLFNNRAVANDTSAAELASILKQREDRIIRELAIRRRGFDERGQDAEIKRADEFESLFRKLSATAIDAILRGKLVHAHETFREIRELLDSDDAKLLFSDWKPVYETKVVDDRPVTVTRYVPERNDRYSHEYFEPIKLPVSAEFEPIVRLFHE